MRDPEKLIAECNESMLEKLQENDHKPSWESMRIQDMVKCLEAEVLELKLAVYIFEHNLCERSKAIDEIRREAADVANFAAMIIQKSNSLKERT